MTSVFQPVKAGDEVLVPGMSITGRAYSLLDSEGPNLLVEGDDGETYSFDRTELCVRPIPVIDELTSDIDDAFNVACTAFQDWDTDDLVYMGAIAEYFAYNVEDRQYHIAGVEVYRALVYTLGKRAKDTAS